MTTTTALGVAKEPRSGDHPGAHPTGNTVEMFSNELKAQMARIDGQPTTALQEIADSATAKIADLKRQRVVIEAGQAAALKERKDRGAVTEASNLAAIEVHMTEVKRLRDTIDEDRRLLEADIKAVDGQFDRQLRAVDKMLEGYRSMLSAVDMPDDLPF